MAVDAEIVQSSRWSPADIVDQAIAADERLWVPMGDGFWVRR
jgi:hypothetical protein